MKKHGSGLTILASIAAVSVAVLLLGYVIGTSRPPRPSSAPPPAAVTNTAGMQWISAGEFTMGTDGSHGMANERPTHRVRVSGFWIDEHPVTNAEFARFVEATGYVTTAEQAPDWEEIRKQ